MTNKTIAGMTLAAGAVGLAATKSGAAVDSAAVDVAIKSLKTYDWGVKRDTLNPIDQAVIATHGDAAGRKKLEKDLVDALVGGISRSAQDFVCRRLRIIGTAQSVKALAALLPDEKTSAIARFALGDISDEAALEALRAALPKVSSKLKPGIIGSLGGRRDKKSVATIAKFLGDKDMMVARAAARALALIATPDSAKALSAFAKKAPACMKMQTADACLVCADKLLAEGEKSAATAIYKELKDADQPKHVKVAAAKGILTAASGK